MTSSSHPRLASYAVYTHPKPLGQQLRKLRAFFNDYHRAVVVNDEEAMERLFPKKVRDKAKKTAEEDPKPQVRKPK